MQKLKKSCPRVTAILLSLMMVVVFVPTFAFAEGGDENTTFSVSATSEGVQEIGTYMDAPLYYVVAPEGAKNVQFSDFAAEGTTIASLYSVYVEDTNTAPISGDWRASLSDLEGDDNLEFAEGADQLNYSSILFYFIMDEEFNMAAYIVSAEVPPVELPDITFTASAGDTQLTEISKEDNAYTYTPYMADPYKVPVYTVTIPLGISEVDLEFSDNVLAYNYTASGTYTGGYYTNFMEGAKSGTVPVNANLEASGEEGTQYYIPADNEFDVIQVQTPYDEMYNSYMLYGITFKYENPGVLETSVSAGNVAKGVKASLPKNYKWTNYPKVTAGKTFSGTASYTDPAVGVELTGIKVNIKALAPTKAQPMTVKAKTATLKYKKLKKKAQNLAVSKVLTVKNAQGKVVYTKVSGNKKITINKTTGKVTVAKKLKKGTYKVKVKVNAAGYGEYKAGAKTVTFKIKVKK